MSAEKKVTIAIETTADTAGAEKAATAMGDLSAEAKKAQKIAAGPVTGFGGMLDNLDADKKNFARLREEAAKLKREINGVGDEASKSLETLADKAKQAGEEMATVGDAAADLGGGLGSDDLGGVMEDLAGGLGDAESGMGGLADAMPALLEKLGGPAGLVGIASIATIGIKFLWDTFIIGAREAESVTGAFANNTKDLLESVRITLATVAQEQKKLAGDEVTRSFERRKDAIEAEKDALSFYIEKLKLAIDQQRALAKFKTQDEIANVEQRVRSGDLTPVEGKNKVTEIRISAITDDLARQKELDALELSKATAQKQAAIAAKQLADDELANAKAKLEEQNAQAEVLRKQVTLRGNLDAQLDDLLKASEKNRADIEANEPVLTSPFDLAGVPLDITAALEESLGGVDRGITKKLEERGAELADAIAKISQRIAAEAPVAVKELAKKDELTGKETTVKPKILEDLERLEKGDASKGVEALSSLSAAVVTLTEKAEAAGKAVKAAQVDEGQTGEANRIKDRNRNDLAGIEAQKDAERIAAAATDKLAAEILQNLPAAAKGPGTNAILEKIKSITQDGQQANENEEATGLLSALGSKIERGNALRAQILQKIGDNQEAQIRADQAVIQKFRDQGAAIDANTRDIRNLKSQQPNPN